MEATGTNYRVTAVPVPSPAGPPRLRLVAVFDDGMVNATTTVDADFKVGARTVKLGDARSIQLGPEPRVVLGSGEAIEGPVSGLGTVPVELGGQPLALDVAKATEIKVAADVSSDLIWYTLRVRDGDKEILKQTESLIVEGLLPVPNQRAGPTGVKPPALEGNTVVRMLPSPAADVAVGAPAVIWCCTLPAPSGWLSST